MSNCKYVDENRQYEFDFTEAKWSTDKLNNIYVRNIQSVLSDVDFIVETDNDEVIFIEYKNADIRNASNPEAFVKKLKLDEHYIKIAQKYYGSLIYILGSKKNKTFKFVYILECAKADSVIRGLIRNKIKNKLPFELQKEPSIKMKLISDFEILSIEEWNKHDNYAKFPIKPVMD